MLLIVWMMGQKACKYCTKGKRRWTWRKWVLLVFLILLVGGASASYVLAGNGLDANAEVTSELIRIFGAAFIGYLLADTGDHYSTNKFGRSEEDI